LKNQLPGTSTLKNKIKASLKKLLQSDTKGQQTYYLVSLEEGSEAAFGEEVGS
jgi:hypothetical protein